MTIMDMREAIRTALIEEMERDPKVFILGEEVAEYQGAYKITKGMLEQFGPERIIDTPIAEAGFTGIAIGAAMMGLRPVVEFMSFNFSFVAFDQIVNAACKMHYMTAGMYNVPIVFRGPNSAAAQVSCQHSHDVASLYAHFPGLIVVAPSYPADAKALLKAAIRSNNPVLFLEHEMEYGRKGEVPLGEHLLPFGKAQVAREGKDVTLVSYSRSFFRCMEVAEKLAGRAVSAEVIDLRSIKPLDLPTISASVRKTGKLVIVEETHDFCGIGAQIAFEVQKHDLGFLDAPIERVTMMETPLPYAKNLEAEALPNEHRILEAVGRVLRPRSKA